MFNGRPIVSLLFFSMTIMATLFLDHLSSPPPVPRTLKKRYKFIYLSKEILFTYLRKYLDIGYTYLHYYFSSYGNHGKND